MSDPQEYLEQVVRVRGRKGAAGAVVGLFALNFLLAGANLLWTSHEVNSAQAARQQAGAAVERKLCATLNGLAALTPPAGNPAANPSRAYLQRQATKLAELGHDLGCR